MNPLRPLARPLRARLTLAAACVALVPAFILLAPAFPSDVSAAEAPDVTITQWQISQAFEVGQLDLSTVEYPRFYSLSEARGTGTSRPWTSRPGASRR